MSKIDNVIVDLFFSINDKILDGYLHYDFNRENFNKYRIIHNNYHTPIIKEYYGSFFYK